MFSRIEPLAFLDIKPTIATAFSGLNIIANASVWLDAVRGTAALITLVLSVPTAFFILLYWMIKARSEWVNRPKRRRRNEDE
jgi:hypothetical protein